MISRQTESLVSMVNLQFGMDPFSKRCVFILCNKRRNAIKVLRYDKNGFILALLENMKFQWPKDDFDVKEVSIRQVEWLLQGLSIDQEKAHREVEIGSEDTYSHKGCLNDNAVAEATFKIMKTEFIRNQTFHSLNHLLIELADYVNWFNNRRIHSSLGYLTPVKYRINILIKTV